MGVPGWCPPASLSSIKRGLGTERTWVGTFRGFATERANLGIFRGFGTERARLGTFKKNLKKMLFFLLKMSTYLLRGFFLKSFGRNSKNRPTCCDFEKKILDPQLHQIFKPIRKIFCTFLTFI